ncbi:hypothetical protein AB1L30_19390 [Bremerella sp. JC817]|uniref:TolB family protein n=1 Tax=Bremerella sp. JC817 TaxID=3231756 RepID=UPI003457D820
MVQARVPFPIVFTSRSNDASMRAAADEGEQFSYPGQSLWQASEGRLRMLLPSGQVSELTWEKPLPDGSTLIDVMSPSISPDGRKIVFAGRKAAPDAGHFRLYEIGVDGEGLRQLTGGPDDMGCTQVPPMRYAEHGTQMLSDDERRKIDYDDVDPTYAPGGHIVFASSRTPDLGRDHARRSTTLWIMNEDGRDKKPLSANRNNDRWPWIADNGYIVFSLWSRNREVVSADQRSIVPISTVESSATLPTDQWLGAHIEPNGDYFGSVLKTREPVWRPRRLENDNFAFMTPTADGTLTVVQAKAGTISSSPSSLAADSKLPASSDSAVVAGPTQDQAGNPLQLATPSMGPGHKILLAGNVASDSGEWSRENFGIYMAEDNWERGNSAEEMKLTQLFDDPQLVDAEPVAVMPRPIRYNYQRLEVDQGMATVAMINGETHVGPTARVHNSAIYLENNRDAPGQMPTQGDSPIFSAPPRDLIEKIHIYASHRDRFDAPDTLRVPGGFELVLEVPIDQDGFEFRIPPGSPTVLAGIDPKGKIASWQGRGLNEDGEMPRFFAFAGDHYSGARPGFTHFCTGCHTGHSGTPTLRKPPK